jgi:hypothetical protein
MLGCHLIAGLLKLATAGHMGSEGEQTHSTVAKVL